MVGRGCAQHRVSFRNPSALGSARWDSSPASCPGCCLFGRATRLSRCSPGPRSSRFSSAGLRSERLCLFPPFLSLLLRKPASLQHRLLREFQLQPQHPVCVRSGKPTFTSLMHPFQWCNGECLDGWAGGDRTGTGSVPSFPVSGMALKASWRPAVLCTARCL